MSGVMPVRPLLDDGGFSRGQQGLVGILVGHAGIPGSSPSLKGEPIKAGSVEPMHRVPAVKPVANKC